MKRILLTVCLGSALLGFTACDKTDDTGYQVPETYNFDNVSYTGQSQRLAMLTELSAYLKTAHANNATALDASKLKDMYGAHTSNPFSNTELNSSSKQLKDKTIATMQNVFDAYLDEAATTSQYTAAIATRNNAGIATANDGKKYLVNINGLEWAQVVEKGLMGACFYYQATAVYLGDGKMDVDNTTVVDGEGTQMEHHWDEAFGYFGVPRDFPQDKTNLQFWGKYVDKHESTYPLNERLMDAFIKGRAAISNEDYTTRDAQIDIIRKDWEILVAATAIYYLNNAKESLPTDKFKSLHELSEVYGFISSLKWGAAGSITTAQVDAILADLFGSADATQANTWEVDATKIETAKTALVGYFSDLASVKDQL